MSTLAVVEEILRETKEPMSVRQIVEHAGSRLPSRSKTPDTVVARDLSMDIKRKGEASIFIRTAPGRYTLRELHQQQDASSHSVAVELPASAPTGVNDVASEPPPAQEREPTPVLSSALRAERASAIPARKPSAIDEQHRAGTP